ncbi:pilin secretion/fimbrial assembly system protein, PilC [Dissulfurispira thermophila]|uniref:Pilin secretion/fimbrial assembly system protein, PilC n=2 Tax=root TaxID=1 RepID=A0A7G1H4I7_9BACT|nr:type II secretion system F family protein [Dissulfurispira thermophila]BCB97119.1 pilin secretion/fimbrial assembly system protein, PilC [Dissulfurispira thermophila]
MNYYLYKAIDADGTMVEGFIEGEDIGSVYGDLSSKGLYILSVKKANVAISYLKKVFASRKIKRRDVIEFANNLSVMLRAGVPLLTALEDISDVAENKYLKTIIADIKRQTEMGMRFSDAIQLHKDIFPDVFVRLITVGEETGHLEKSLSDVASHLQRMEDLSAAIKRALIYPIFAIVTTMGALIFWLAYVLPKIMTTLKEMGVKLPLITRILLHVSDFTKAYWYLIPILPVAFFFVLQVLKQMKGARYYIDLIKIKLPIVKLVVYNKLLALFSEQLRILIVSGLTIDRSFNIISDVMGSEVFKRAIILANESISSGSRIADALREHKVFPPLVARMVDIGETSGNLDEQFAFLSDHYLKKLDDISEKMGKMIEPIVIAVIGVLFALIIVGLMLPIYDLITQFGKAG